MIIKYRESFSKDVKVLDKTTKKRIEKLLAHTESLKNFTEIPNLKKVKGDKAAYRIRVGDYRVGIFVFGNTIEFTRCLHRNEIYRYFP